MKKNLLVWLLVFGVASFSMAQDPEPEPVISTSSPSGAAGDTSIQFKGTSSLGVDDAAEVLNIIEGPITIETWVMIDDYADFWTGLVSWGFTYKLGLSNDGQFIFTFFGIVDIFSGYDLTPFIGDGQWHHLAAVWESGLGVTFFVDGEDVGIIAETGSPRAPQGFNFTVGGENNGTVPFIGKMDRVRIHNAAVLEGLDSVADAPKPPLDTTIVHYDFDEAGPPFASSGSAVLDLDYQNAVLPASSAGGWELYQ